jgi:OFA family oxalate/formate antiporter-like MFS transporter
MKKYVNLAAAFFIMLCLGSVYAWSIFVPELKAIHGFTTAQTQLVFGVLIAVFTIMMIFAGRLDQKHGPRLVAIISALLFGSGYILAGLSGGHFLIVLLGIGILAGSGTGFGYLISITNTVKWFPERKGLVTGVAAAGFGLGAIVLTWFSDLLLQRNYQVLEVFKIIGISYGIIILLFSFMVKGPVLKEWPTTKESKKWFTERAFILLFLGILCGTFAGLLVIGNLRPIGAQYALSQDVLLLGISIFSAANFAGRLIWGWLSDFLSGRQSIFIALGLQALFVFLIGFFRLQSYTYLIFSGAIGFGFGANFVLFAKETAHIYGINRLSSIYPFVFLGYGLAGILGPVTGGFLFDLVGNYVFATYIAATISLVGAITGLFTRD